MLGAWQLETERDLIVRIVSIQRYHGDHFTLMLHTARLQPHKQTHGKCLDGSWHVSWES